MTTAVTLDAFAETVARAISRYPAEKGRIERGACLVTTGHVEQIHGDLFAVRSQRDADTTYLVDNSGCPCDDQKRHPELVCKHRWAVALLVIAEQRAARLAERQAPAAPAADDETATRTLLARLIEERAARARLVYATGNLPIEDPHCNALGEQIARLRASLPPVSFRSTVAA